MTGTTGELQQATAYCQESLTEAQLQAAGGLVSCVEDYLDGGSSALDALVSLLTLP